MKALAEQITDIDGVNIYGRVVGVRGLMVEIAGQESKIEAFIDLMRPYGILELARTGRIALVRGVPGQGVEP